MSGRAQRAGEGHFYHAKKRFGQHFLKDDLIAENIVNSLTVGDKVEFIVEIGPGQGVLTKFLLEKFGKRFHAVEIDRDLFQYLSEKLPSLKGRLHNEDFLKADLSKLFQSDDFSIALPAPFDSAQDDQRAGHGERSRTMKPGLPFFPGSIAIIGNFPYNISTQIIFRMLDYREQVKMMVGMFQKEVAKRVVAKPGSKDYGIISVLLSCWYDREYLFELPPGAFSPPPKVHSAVVRLTRNNAVSMDCDEALFKTVVKTAFNQRRKMLRNSLSGLVVEEKMNDELFKLRPEQLSVDDFVKIVKMI